jgi:hypothetical protein
MVPNFVTDNWLPWLYGLIYELCNKPYKYIDNSEDIHIRIKWPRHQYACSILLRVAYGGMKGDMCLLKICAHNVAMSKEGEFHIHKTRCMEPISKLKFIAAAVDFHCVPRILQRMHEKYPHYTESEIKEAIWDHFSSIRFDIPRKKNTVLWDEIKISVRRYQVWYIKFIQQNL